MMKRIVKIIVLAAISMITVSTPVLAAGTDSFEAQFAAYLAEVQQNSMIAKQNKAAYDATATPLQKQVDALIDISRNGTDAQGRMVAAQLQALLLSTPDWSSNFTVPLTCQLPPRAVAIKTGYRFDQDSIRDGDLRLFVWALEDGEVVSCNMDALPATVRRGGFHESFNYYYSHISGE